MEVELFVFIKVEERLGDIDTELKDLDRRSTKSETNIQNNRKLYYH